MKAGRLQRESAIKVVCLVRGELLVEDVDTYFFVVVKLQDGWWIIS
jgi:hypothetical protein